LRKYSKLDRKETEVIKQDTPVSKIREPEKKFKRLEQEKRETYAKSNALKKQEPIRVVQAESSLSRRGYIYPQL
jgi:hypothetical protein